MTRIKLAIHGPCTLRDAFSIEHPLSCHFNVQRFVQNNSLLSWGTDTFEATTGASFKRDDFPGVGHAWFNWFRINTGQMSLKEYLDQKPATFLVTSLVDIINDLLVFESGSKRCIINRNKCLSESNFLSKNNLQPKQVSPTEFESSYVANKIDEFIAFFDNYYTQDNILFFELRPVNKYKKDGRIFTFMGDDKFEENIKLIDFSYNYVRDRYPWLHTISIDCGDFSDPWQRWGIGSMHYTPGIYQSILESTYKSLKKRFSNTGAHIQPGNKKLGIVLVTNQKYVFACGAMILNIIDKIRDFTNIIVYHGGISEVSQSDLAALDSRVKLIEYSAADFKCEFPCVTDELLDTTYFKLYSYLNSSKFRIFKLLRGYDQVVLLDTDMLIYDSLSELLENEDANIIWRYDRQTIKDKLSIWKQDLPVEAIEGYKDFLTPNGGFMIINNNFDYMEAYRKGSQFFTRACQLHPYSLNETTFGYIASTMELNIKDVDSDVYNVYPDRFNASSKLVHFLGRYKPWISEIVQYTHTQWLTYYTDFAKSTHEQFSEVRLFSRRGEYIVGQYREYVWKDLLSKLTTLCSVMPQGDTTSPNLALYYSPLIYFKLDLDWGITSVSSLLVVENSLKSVIPDLDLALSDIENIANDHKFKNDGKRAVLSLDSLKLESFPRDFLRFFKKMDTVFSQRSRAVNSSCQQIGRFKTHFDKYLHLKDDFLYQSNEVLPDEVVEIVKIGELVAFRSPDGQYIRHIASHGHVSLSVEPYYFMTKVNGDRLQVIAQGLHLSARDNPDGDVHLVPQCRDWESFLFEPLAQSKICLSPSGDTALPEASLLRLSQLCIPVDSETCADPKKLAGILNGSELFNAEFYLKTYSDVAESKIDPLIHYATFGWREHRNPAPWFRSDFYREHNRNIDFNVIDPFLHYIARGYGEGRLCSPMKDK